MIIIQWLIPEGECDLAEFGPTAHIVGGDGAHFYVQENAEWLEHDGEQGVYARFVGTEEDTYMHDEGMHPWKVMP